MLESKPELSTLPLSGVRVIEICHVAAGPFCGMLLSDFGAAWLERLKVAGIPSGPLNSYEEALSDPQSEHLQLVQPMTLPGGTETHTVVCPIWLDGAPVAVNTRSPELDEHRTVLEAELPDSC